MSKSNKTAMEAALSYLSSRMRTVHEVRKYLKEKGYDEAEADKAVNELTELRYLDDSLYAERYYAYNREKKRGMARAAGELRERGVDDATIRNAGEDFLYENKTSEYEVALSVAMREAEGREIDEKMISRIARRLESRGFGGSDIIRVLDELRRSAREGN